MDTTNSDVDRIRAGKVLTRFKHFSKSVPSTITRHELSPGFDGGESTSNQEVSPPKTSGTLDNELSLSFGASVRRDPKARLASLPLVPSPQRHTAPSPRDSPNDTSFSHLNQETSNARENTAGSAPSSPKSVTRTTGPSTADSSGSTSKPTAPALARRRMTMQPNFLSQKSKTSLVLPPEVEQKPPRLQPKDEQDKVC